MCNLYPMAPRDHVERYFRAMVPAYGAVPVGPFGTELFLRPIDGRVHKPDPKLPVDAQDKRSVVPLEPDQWMAWFEATPDEAMGLLVAPPAERFDRSDAQRTDQLLGQQTGR